MAEITITHAPDRAVVLFAGTLDWQASHELVETIGTGVETYFYRRLELVIASPGGDARAFAYFYGAVQAWRERGVRFTTRVFSVAASSAAIMVSMGDERVADPGARLGYHHSRLEDSIEITAKTSLDLRAALRAVDECMLDALVDRVLVDRHDPPSVPYEAERSDREVLERLCAALPGVKAGKRIRKRRLARVLGRHVERAVRDGDRKALGDLYRQLFGLEILISARLALTLRLVDRVGPRGAQEQRPAAETTGLTVPEWASLFPPAGEISREVLTRHALVLGETGSGKTASAILPVVAAMARAPRDQLGGALIIDPKREILSVVESLVPQRLHHVRAEEALLNIMAGPRWSLDEYLAQGRWESAAVRILCRIASFVRSNPARVLMDHEVETSNAEFFDREGTSLVTTVLAVILMLTSPDLPDPAAWLEKDVEAYDWVSDFLQRARGSRSERGPNVLTLAAWALSGPLMSYPSDGEGVIRIPLDSSGSRRTQWLFSRIAKGLLDCRAGELGEGRDVLRRVLDYWDPMAQIDRQYAGVRAVASTVCSDFAAPVIARTLYFGCESEFRSKSENGLDFARLVSCDGPGMLIVFQPARDGLDNLVAVALKAAFFEAVLDNTDRARGGKDLPLVGYVADEFHRFITSDPLHGEQSFLDTCRSFGAFCVLASQSVASLEHALAHGGGTSRQDESVVEIIWNNTASKFVFRSTDPKTSDRVADLCPYRPGLAGVVRVRPVSSLGTGECYAVLADSRFERRQLAPFQFEGPGPEEARPKLLCGPSPAEEVGHDRA